MNERQACSWLSEARYARFREACGGDHASAVALYEWHAVLGMAAFGLIHHFEVLLRNAIDRTLGEGQAQTGAAEIARQLSRFTNLTASAA
jgi:hypothetical protein